MKPSYELNGERYNASPVRQTSTGGATLNIDGVECQVQFKRVNANELLFTLNGKQQSAFVAQDDDTLFVHLNGRTHQLLAITEFAEAAAAGGSSGQIKAPMPGVVLECSVAEGDAVEEGQSLMMIESMKLQTEITAPLGGTVSALNLEAGQPFDKGSVLIAINAEDAE